MNSTNKDINKKELKSVYHNLNPQYQKFVIKGLKVLQNDGLNDFLNTYTTIIIPNNKNIENKINNNNYIINQKNIIDKGETKDNKNQHIKQVVQKSSLNNLDDKNHEIKNNLNYDNCKNIKFQKKENDFNNYSFNSLTNNLNFMISKKTKQFSFTMELENNGKNTWPQNRTILSTDPSISNIQMKNIILEPLKPGFKSSINGIFTDIDKLKPGKYHSYLIFKVDGRKYGNNILINIEVLENDNDIKKEYKSVIDNFRNDYDIPRNIVSDTVIIKELRHQKTFEDTYKSLSNKLNEKK